ncbi:MAG: cupin domain-containing protein [Candidatus Kapabacteria bacterium]|nr:cupin domain-containing protein [Candidatus Kapabacteria bacterium]
MKQEKIENFINPAKSKKIIQLPGLETTILTGLYGGEMMMALNTTLPGEFVPIHSHPHEQIGMVYSGKGLLRIGDEQRVVEKGDFFCIPANTPHGDACIGAESFVMLDIFYPVREDFIQKFN